MKKGFTLIELMIAVAILAIISSGLMSNLINSQKKARDSQRKSDLKQIQNALEAYYNDYGQYPADGSLTWGSSFTDGKTTYMQTLPQDPSEGISYYYDQTLSGQGYKLYSCLENDRDPDYNNYVNNCLGCGSAKTCHYGSASGNETL